MRISRKRVFRITINGTQEFTEEAGLRSAIEVQHSLATERFPGARVRVQELYLGGAKARLDEEEEQDEE